MNIRAMPQSIKVATGSESIRNLRYVLEPSCRALATAEVWFSLDNPRMAVHEQFLLQFQLILIGPSPSQSPAMYGRSYFLLASIIGKHRLSTRCGSVRDGDSKITYRKLVSYDLLYKPS
jgi:hypothetical protein